MRAAASAPTATEPVAAGAPTQPTSGGRVRRVAKRLAAFGQRHPVLAVAGLAFLVRAVFAVAIIAMRDGVLIPDEMQYIELATAAADGRGAAGWNALYGPSLFSASATFLIPLTALFKVFGAWRVWGQLLAAAGGAATAAMAMHVAGQLVRPRFAALAGLVVGFWPSQVLWSSVVLRESFVWASLAAIAVSFVAMSNARSNARLVGAIGGVGLSLWALSHLRVQTFVAAAWAAAITVPFLRGRHRRLRTVAVWALVLVVPLETGQGLGAWGQIERAVPTLGRTRVASSTNAASSFIGEVTTPAPPSGSPSTTRTGSSTGSPTATPTSIPLVNTPGLDFSEPTMVVSGDGSVYVVQESAGANVRYLPKGLVSILARPFPWEPTNDVDLSMARGEDALWFVLYAFALLGLWRLRRQWPDLAFPVVCAVGTLSVAALVQGNLGTAFRHRAQVLWVLAIVASAGVQHVVDRWAARRSSSVIPS